MAENQLQGQQPAKQASTAVLVKQMISQENVRKKFAEVLGQKALSSLHRSQRWCRAAHS